MTELLVPVFHFDVSVPVNSTGYPKDRYIYKVRIDLAALVLRVRLNILDMQ